MALKLFYLTTEISPFASTGSLAEFSAKVPLQLQGKGHDIRTIIPKYGFVSERKYILREVIRLREIPFQFDGIEQMASAKSAFIPRTRVQVYFLEHKEWFKPLSNLLYKSKNGRVLSNNDERFAFFGKASLATLPHLFWSPDILLCNGWQSAFVPMLYEQVYKSDPFYENIKTVQIIFSLDEYADFGREAYEKAGVTLPDDIKGDTINAYEVAAHFAQQIIIFDKPSQKISSSLLKLPGFKKQAKKVEIIPWSDDEAPDYTAIADAMDAAFLKLSD